MEETRFSGKHPRRKFLTGFCSALAGLIAALALPKKARAGEAGEKDAAADTGPILYHRTEEAERYYRTLYR
jgi:predicted Zn-dependent protease